MSKVIVSENAIRDLIREIFDNKDPDAPVNVNHVVDLSAVVTDPYNTKYVPNNKVELQVAIKALSDELPDEDVSDVYSEFINAIDKSKDKDEEKMNRNMKVENFIRLQIRRMLDEGILAPGETYAPDSEVELWEKEPWRPIPSGYEVGSADKKGKRQKLIKKAMRPEGMSVTKIPTGVMGSAAAAKFGKSKSKLQSMLGTTEEDEEFTLGSEKDFTRWAKTVIPVSDAMKYREVYIEAFKENLEDSSASEEDREWRMTTETKTFQKMFKDTFGKTFRAYCLPVGAAVKKRLSDGVNYSASDVGGEDVAQSLADEFGVSRSGLKNIEDEVLAKVALGMVAEMPDEEEVLAGIELPPVEESASHIVNSYVKVLAESGKLNSNDVQILNNNPEFVSQLPGFQEYFRRHLSLIARNK